MDSVSNLIVRYDNLRVGTLALYDRRLAAFEYDERWLAEGFSISPRTLPLEKRVFMPTFEPFDGLFGVFDDSLPDGWGRLLVDRVFLKNGINPHSVSCLDRLAVVGKSGMGALVYEPEHTFDFHETEVDLDKIAADCSAILNNKEADDLDSVFRLGGSSGGARPKILTKVDGEDWIIKFPSSFDRSDSGSEEYRYSLCAVKCGIEMERTRLFPSSLCSGYFGTHRFDRRFSAPDKTKKIHMISVAGMLETSHRIPNLDYRMLMALTLDLTRDFTEVEKMFKLMCFNVFAHNRDDHSRNFTYLFDMDEGIWKLSPAYDLTYSSSIGGEHATTVNGNGRDPGIEDILEVGRSIGLKERRARVIADDIRSIIFEEHLLDR